MEGWCVRLKEPETRPWLRCSIKGAPQRWPSDRSWLRHIAPKEGTTRPCPPADMVPRPGTLTQQSLSVGARWASRRERWRCGAVVEAFSSLLFFVRQRSYAVISIPDGSPRAQSTQSSGHEWLLVRVQADNWAVPTLRGRLCGYIPPARTAATHY